MFTLTRKREDGKKEERRKWKVEKKLEEKEKE